MAIIERFPWFDLSRAVPPRADGWCARNQAARGVLAAAVLLSACSASASASRTEQRPTTSVATSRTSVDPGALRIGQRAETSEGNVVHLLTYQQSVPPAVVEPDPGMEFAAIEAEICAGQRAPARATAEGFQIEMVDGSRRGRSFFGPKKPALTGDQLAKGACVRGWVNFEVPQGKRPAYVVFQGSSLVRWAAGGRL